MIRVILFFVSLITSNLLAQNTFESQMKKGFNLWEANKAIEASKMFEKASELEPNNWLPLYYASHALIVDGFTLNNTVILETQLNKAQTFINRANILSKNNSELLVLQALLYTVYVASDGKKYGYKYAEKIDILYKTAYKLTPNNPRVLLSKTEWAMGAAQFLGEPVTAYCNDLKKALKLFTTFKPKSSFHPNWGENRTKQVLKGCK